MFCSNKIVSSKALDIVATAVNRFPKGIKALKALELFLKDTGRSIETKDLKKASVLIYCYLSNFDFVKRGNLKRFINNRISISNRNKLKDRIYNSRERTPLIYLDSNIVEELLIKTDFLKKDREVPVISNNFQCYIDYKKSFKLKKDRVETGGDNILKKLKTKSQLNKNQKQAINTTDQKVLVVSNPGTGKTKVLVERAIRLLQNAIKVNSDKKILLVTFTVKAAKEIEDRISRILQGNGLNLSHQQLKDVLECRTFHSWSYQLILKQFPEIFGFVSSGKKPQVIDDNYKLSLIQQAMDNSHVDDNSCGHLRLEDISRIIDFIINKEKDVDLFFRGNKKFKIIYNIYQQFFSLKRNKNLLDFNDLISLVDTKLRTDDDFRETVSNIYSHILVDEVQDCNNHQFRILKQLSKGNKNLHIFVCGDEKQSIYGFRSSDYRNMSKFVSKFDASVLYLDSNYRSYQNILDLANITARCMRVNSDINNVYELKDTVGVRGVSGGASPQLPTYTIVRNKIEQSIFIAKSIKQLFSIGVKARDIAILTRTNNEISDIIGVLKERGIPFIKKGGNNRREPYIKSLLDFIQIFDSFEKEFLWKNIFYNLIIKDKVGCQLIYDKMISVEKRSRTAADANSFLYQKILSKKQSIENILKTFDKNLIHANYKRMFFGIYIKALKYISDNVYIKQNNDCTDLLTTVTDILGDLFRTKFNRKEDTVYNVLSGVVYALSDISNNDFRKLRELITLAPETVNEWSTVSNLPTKDLERKYGGSVTISTIHGYKGLEADNVFLANCVEGSLPLIYRGRDDNIYNLVDKEYQLNEERRLFYVACTRARNKLFIVAPINKKKGFTESRFIKEIKKYLIDNNIDNSVFATL